MSNKGGWDIRYEQAYLILVLSQGPVHLHSLKSWIRPWTQGPVLACKAWRLWLLILISQVYCVPFRCKKKQKGIMVTDAWGEIRQKERKHTWDGCVHNKCLFHFVVTVFVSLCSLWVEYGVSVYQRIITFLFFLPCVTNYLSLPEKPQVHRPQPLQHISLSTAVHLLWELYLWMILSPTQ